MDHLVTINSILLVIVMMVNQSHQECNCFVRIRGEYCGSELNKKNANNECQKDMMYFCGDGNQDKTAVPMIKCKDQTECSGTRTRASGRARRSKLCEKA